MGDQQLVGQTIKRVGMAFSRQKTNGAMRSEQGPGQFMLWLLVWEGLIT